MHFDLIVVGSGPVGASLACALHPLRIALVGQQAPVALAPGALDARAYALSPGNVAFLRELGAWAQVAPERVCPVQAMRIFGDDGRSELAFDAYRAGVAELAWIVEDAVLQQALWKEVQARETVQRFVPAQCASLQFAPGAVTLTLRDGRTLSANLVAGADGAQSFVRESAGIRARTQDYRQAAVVGNFACEIAHEQVAYQWFHGGTVLALLPLPGKRVSMVWSLPIDEAERLCALSAQALGSEVAAASRNVLGRLSLVTEPRSYRLQRIAAEHLVGQGVALLGDAAHVVHPLAGQGLNLGLQDARALAATLAGREEVLGLGDRRLLRRYERERAEPILSMQLMVYGLFRLFGASGGPAARLRNAGLNLTDRLPVLKNVLMRHAMR